MKLAYVVMDGYDEYMASRGEVLDEFPIVQRECARLDVEVTRERWRDPDVHWARFDAVVPKACWDYFTQSPGFFAWLTRLRERHVQMVNPLDLVRWNSDKSYLVDLRDAGVRVAPLLHFPEGTHVDLPAEIAKAGWGEFVIKPAIAGGAYRTARASSPHAPEARELATTILQASGLLLQPFFPEIPRDGEWSLLFFGGVFSHAVLKRPKSDDFRSQPIWGATTVAEAPPPALLEQARAVLDAVPGRAAYARIDGFLREGELHVMEVELIEPYLFLEHGARDAPRRFCEAVLAQIQTDSTRSPSG